MLRLNAFQVIFVMTWFPGLFYLLRLFVYHAPGRRPDRNRHSHVRTRRLNEIPALLAIGMVNPVVVKRP